MGFSYETTAVASSPKGIPAMLSAPWMRNSGAQIWNLKQGSSHEAVSDLIKSIIDNQPEDKDAFYILDLGVLTHLYERWTTYLPGIKPFYAVKCNPNSLMLRSMRALGSNFDCASRAEIETIIGMGVSPDRIVFANPCKPESHIRYAASVGVNLTTYDSVDEVEKIKRCHPNCSLLLRLKAPEDEGARIPLGSKYGALPEEVVPLLEAAKSAAIPVIGVSFHVGSGMTHAHPYKLAIEASKAVFDEANRLNMPAMKVLDIGGGFTAGGTSFEEAASVIRSSIARCFSDVPDLTVFGEPGRFFAETAFTLATAVIGKRVRGDLREYWLNDGIYGSMNCIVFDYKTVAPTPLACASDPKNPTCASKDTHKSTVFGPTCDSLDTLLTDYQLPELKVDDWLVFNNMGAYTTSAASNFNGFSISDIKTHLAYSKKF